MESRQILKMNRKVLLCLLLLVFTCPGCVTYVGYDGPYEGKIIDKDTRQPIEGVVVHGTWYRAHPLSGSSYYDSKEVLTDKDGKFKINGVGLLIFSNMQEMQIFVLKAGYNQIRGCLWQSLKGYNKDVEWEGSKPIIKLRKMTLEERRKRIMDSPDAPNKTMKLFMREANKENIEIGSDKNTLFPSELLK
jgi:hypothetical protein